jgi:hypothetical protein
LGFVLLVWVCSSAFFEVGMLAVFRLSTPSEGQ